MYNLLWYKFYTTFNNPFIGNILNKNQHLKFRNQAKTKSTLFGLIVVIHGLFLYV